MRTLLRITPLLGMLALGLLVEPAAQQRSGAVKFPGHIAPRNDFLIENLVPITMRDGVTLYADVYRPVGDGKYPVLISRTPYSTERFPSAYDGAVYFAQRGYVYIFQDVRGRHESDGAWNPFFDDEKDGVDTIAWAAKQPWSNGKVAMQGGSYLGQNQWRAAQAEPPALVTIFPMVSSTSIYHDWITLNGGWRLSFNFGWGPVRMESRIMQNSGPHTLAGVEAIHYDRVQWHLPLNTMQKLVGRKAKFYDDWIAHPDYDDYWKPLSVEEHFEQDHDSRAHVRRMVRHLQPGNAARLCRHEPERRHREGPAHEPHRDRPLGPRLDAEVRRAGLRADARCRHNAIQLRWYDYWLKGIDNGFTTEPPVKLFVMGRNEWVYEREYPLARTQYRPMYFGERGKREQRSRRRASELDEAGRTRPSPIASATIPTIRCPRSAATTAAGRRPPPARWISGRSRGRRDILSLHVGLSGGGARSHRSGESRAPRLSDASTPTSSRSWWTSIPTAPATTWPRASCAHGIARA